MSDDEAVKVARVLADVDGGCVVCARNAADDMAREFPEWDWRQMVDLARGWNSDLKRAIRVAA